MIINGNDNGNFIVGTIGNDIIHGNGGDDNIIGEGGLHDELFGDAGNDSIDAGNGGSHTLDGGDGNDQLFGGDGNDLLNGGSGSDFMQGSKGNDLYVVDSASDVVREDFNNGIDTVQSSISFFLNLSGTKAVENLILTGTGNNTGTGNALNNLIIGNAGNNSLFGEGGDDQIFGGDGNDSLFADEGNNTIDGGNGTDTFFVNTIDNQVRGNYTLTNNSLKRGDGTDSLKNIEAVQITAGDATDDKLDATAATNFTKVTLDGGGGNDTVLGSKASDKLGGNAGNDILAGGAGNDELTGAGGQDKFVFNTGNVFKSADLGIDFILDFGSFDKIVLDKKTFTTINSNVGDGFSQSDEFKVVTTDQAAEVSNADIVYNSANGNLFYNQNGNSAGFGTGGQFAKINLGFTKAPLGAGNFQIQSGSSIGLTGVPSAQLASGVISFVGSALGGIVQGNALDNKISTKAGNDIALGGNGNDLINGGGGDDILFGGKANDTLIGGAGSDVFVLALNNGVDVIRGYQDGIDRLGLKQLTFDQLQFTQQGSRTEISAQGQKLAILENVQVNQLSADDFVNVAFSKTNGIKVPGVV